MKQQPDRSDQFEALRESIKADELAAEKYQQEEIERLVIESGRGENGSAGSSAITHNIDMLLQAMQLPRDAMIDANLATISSKLE